MRRTVVVLALSGLLAGAASAAAPRGLLAPAPIAAIAADERWVAFAAVPSARDCDRVRVWNRRTGRVTRLGKSTSCEVTSTGRGISGLAQAGNRTLWLHYVGGNIREYQLFTATTTAPRARRIAFASGDPEAPPPIVVGHGDASPAGDLLPFSVARTVIALNAGGRRVFQWTAPRNITALGARAGGLAVALSDGRVVIFENTADATPDAEWTGAPAATAVFVTGNAVAAQRGSRVELRAADGAVATRTLPVGARLHDAFGSRVLYRHRGIIWSVDVRSSASRRVGAGVDAEFESGVVLASGRRISIR